MKYIFVFLIEIYQKCISPFFPSHCRFIPTCSQYGKEAIMKYGIFKGGWLTFKRLLRCHPGKPGGYDPVP